MKNFLSLLCILSLCFGCDKAYDLNKIESGDVTIGNDQSEWIMPLAQITVGMDELQDGSADIRAIFDEVDIWLPTTLPGNAEWVDMSVFRAMELIWTECWRLLSTRCSFPDRKKWTKWSI